VCDIIYDNIEPSSPFNQIVLLNSPIVALTYRIMELFKQLSEISKLVHSKIRFSPIDVLQMFLKYLLFNVWYDSMMCNSSNGYVDIYLN